MSELIANLIVWVCLVVSVSGATFSVMSAVRVVRVYRRMVRRG